MNHDKDEPELVRGRSEVHLNQTGSGFMKDKRTKRRRDRSTRERLAREASEENE